jgi:glycosyltransferase involved in cell wall biosynthesis
VNLAILGQLVRAANLDIELITSALGRTPAVEQFAEHVRIFKVPVNSRNIHHSSNRELVTYAGRALRLALQRQRAQPFDFCFAWSTLPAGAVALALRRLTGLRYLLRVCGPDIPGFEQRYGTLYPVLTPLIHASWHGAEMVIAKCAREASMIRASDRSISATLVPNGVDSLNFQPGAPGDDRGPLRLLSVARLIERKGQRYLIEAVKRLGDEGIDVTLELVGTGDAQAANAAQARALGVAERVRFAGYVPREQVAAHYRAAQVFVLASYNEGMSVATLEAMAAGLPVVVTRTGGTAELVEEGSNGLTFDWADVDTLTAHLRRLATNRALARQMGAASRARAQHFTWDSATERYLTIFEQMAQRPIQAPAATSLQQS